MFEDIKQQFKEVIEYSQNIYNANIDELFDRWLDAKRDFIEAFGGKLIVEMPDEMSFNIDKTERENRIRDFQCLIENKYNNYALSDFIEAMMEGFYKNETCQGWTAPDGTKIPKGMKIVKAFKYFEKDKDVLFNLQNEASRIIQEDKVKGKLCFSVHPLDFLSSSENTHNWRSCHALDGEYRSGNLSYMVDSSTIMVYLKSEQDEILPDFPKTVPWNSKKWRVLLFLSDDWKMLFAGRQYPFTSERGIEIVKDYLPQLNLGLKWSNWHSYKLARIIDPFSNEEYSLGTKVIPVGDMLIPMNRLIKDIPGSLQFNDLLNSSCYDPIYAYQIDEYKWGTIKYTGESDNGTIFYIGGRVNCLCCGKRPITVQETMMCNECESEFGDLNSDDFGYCSCCNRHFYLEDAIWIDDEPVCPSCVDTETDRCESCGEIYFTNDLIYDRENGITVCKYCNDGRRYKF